MSGKTLGELAFDAYNSSRGGVNHLGKQTPPWGLLTPEIREAWEAAALAVLREVAGTVPEPEAEPTQLFCSLCHEPQFETPAGTTCVNGHGGADGIPG